MKVADIMHKAVISVSEDAPITEVARLIFSLGLGGVPVVRERKLIGIITEQDIVSKMYPTMNDIVEDYVHAKDFEQMETNLKDLLEETAKEIMNKNVTSILPDRPIMEAQSMMLLQKFSRLPVVDKENNLVGIISQGDIFRQLIKEEIPKLEQERYADFIAAHYDLMVNWDKRFNYEFPALLKLIKEKKIKSLLDIGAWTGEYTIGLAKKTDINILGLDHNQIMYETSKAKKEKLPGKLKEKIQFIQTDFKNLSLKINKKYDAAICMGNSLPYIPVSLPELFKDISSILKEKQSVFLIQILNFDKILKTKNRLLSFTIQRSNEDKKKEHLFMEFFDKNQKDCLSHHVVIFESDGKNWIYKGITTINIYCPTKVELEKELKKAGFTKIVFSGTMGEYQGEYGELSFTETFNPKESDWLNVLATK